MNTRESTKNTGDLTQEPSVGDKNDDTPEELPAHSARCSCSSAGEAGTSEGMQGCD